MDTRTIQRKPSISKANHTEDQCHELHFTNDYPRKTTAADPAQSAPSAERYAELKELANHRISKFGTDGRVQLPAYKLIAILIRLEQAETRAETAESALREAIALIKLHGFDVDCPKCHRCLRGDAGHTCACGYRFKLGDVANKRLRALLTVAAQTPEEK